MQLISLLEVILRLFTLPPHSPTEWNIRAIKIIFQRKYSHQGRSHLQLVRAEPWSLMVIFHMGLFVFKAWLTMLLFFFTGKVNWGYWFFFLLKWYSNLCLLNIHQLAVSHSPQNIYLCCGSWPEWKKNGGGEWPAKYRDCVVLVGSREELRVERFWTE